MRLFYCLLKNARAPQDPTRVPLRKPRLPFKLHNSVSGRAQDRDKTNVVQETINLINALATQDYNQKHCAKEIKAMQDASQKSVDEMRAVRLENQSGEIPPGRNLRPRQLNKFLQRFPQP